MSTITGTITTGVTLGTGSYTSPLTITATGIVSDNVSAAVYAGRAYASPVLLNQGQVIATEGRIAVRFMDGGSVDNSGLIGGDFGSVYMYGAAGTVTNSGTIAGTGTNPQFLLDAAVVLATGGTVTNSGTIEGTGAWKGVHLLLGGGVDNDGGLIRGAFYGVSIAGGGTITNSGTIAATVTFGYGAAAVVLRGGGHIANNGGLIAGMYGVRLNNGGSVANNAGLIQGTRAGISVGTSAGTVSNSGTIDAGSTGVAGVFLATGGSVNNDGGSITGGDVGIGVYGAVGSVTNSGVIVATRTGVVLYAGGNVTNNAGVITGSEDGAYLRKPGTVINSGTIVTTATYGVGAGAVLHNGGYIANNGGLIGGLIGVRLKNGGVVANNAGSIQGTNYGVRVLTSTGTVNNSGTIAAGSSGVAGVFLAHGGSVTNNAGSITGGTAGVGIYGAPGTVTNSGVIVGTRAGIALAADGNVANNGGVITGSRVGIDITPFSTVTNSGIVAATGTNVGYRAYGIRLIHGGSVTNSGTIKSTYYGIRSVAQGGSIVNAGGLIDGRQGVNLSAGGTVINSGTIVGTSGVAIAFGGTSGNLLKLQAGYAILGGVRGSSSGPAIDVLELDSAAGTPLTVDYNGLGLTYFDKVLFGAGNYATLKVSNTSGILPATISGFDSPSEIIDLTAIGSNGQVINHDTANHRLTVSGSLGSLTLQLDASDGSVFTTAPDGTGGTNLIACFLRGTLIRTASGEVPVEALTIGDRVVTLSGEAKPIRWIGRRAYDPRFVAGNRRVLPVCIGAGALDETTPRRDLWVSPEHSLLIDGILVRAMHLVNGATITQPAECDPVEYFHVELETHDVIFAEGATVETFIDCDNRFMFQNAADYSRLYPDDARPHWQFCAPRPDRASAKVTAIRAALLELAESRGQVSRDPDLHLIVDGCPVQARSVAEGAYRFVVPAGAHGITIGSRTAIPAETEPNSADLRPLGVPLRQLMLHGDGVRLEITSGSPALRDGFHTNEGSHRWTNGRGRLPSELLACFEGEVAIEVLIGATELHYPTDAPTAGLRHRQQNTAAYSAAALSGMSGSMPRARL